VGALLGMLILGAVLGYLIWRSGWRIATLVLALVALLVPVGLTIRTTVRFCYVTDEYPTEFLVYAHAAPGVSEAMRQIEELSRRLTGSPNGIRVAYGEDGSTLWYWQLRNYPNAVSFGTQPSGAQMNAPVIIAGRDQWGAVTPYLGDEYYYNTYTYLWWPMQDYFGLTWERIKGAITNPRMRAALWDIWYDRDYRLYDQITGKTHTLDRWPLRADFRLYIRRDVAARIWELATTEPTDELEMGEVTEGVSQVDPYAAGWQDLAARLVFGSAGMDVGQFQGPRGIKVGADGYVYVADAGNHRIQKFTADGQFVASFGTLSTLKEEGQGPPRGFLEPWDVAVAPDGSIYVADTWNHRIQRLDPNGNLARYWGSFGQYGTEDPAGHGAFYGLRGIVLGNDGNIYVADTGKKCIQVFAPDGWFLYQWGGGGVLEGYLDEPVGIAISADGEVYVADTWNRRVQVFNTNGVFLRQWPIAGWDTGDPEEKPYLAVDSAGYVYVTDPARYRVLVFDSLGNYVLSFGKLGTDERSFGMPMGIAVAPNGSIYVTDARNSRVMVFDPLSLSPPSGTGQNTE
jgi:DNA-binding beta-propeller fold protein YncE